MEPWGIHKNFVINVVMLSAVAVKYLASTYIIYLMMASSGMVEQLPFTVSRDSAWSKWAINTG